jgi:hypothetical protein
MVYRPTVFTRSFSKSTALNLSALAALLYVAAQLAGAFVGGGFALALVGEAGLGYPAYPEGMLGRPLQEVGLDLATPQLSEAERERIEPKTPGGMLLDSARYHTMAGLSLDVYFQPGVFISPRALVAVPLLTPVTASGLGFWWELSLSIGYAL